MPPAAPAAPAAPAGFGTGVVAPAAPAGFGTGVVVVVVAPAGFFGLPEAFVFGTVFLRSVSPPSGGDQYAPPTLITSLDRPSHMSPHSCGH